MQGSNSSPTRRIRTETESLCSRSRPVSTLSETTDRLYMMKYEDERPETSTRFLSAKAPSSRDSRGRQLPVVNTVTSNCSSAANSTVFPFDGSAAQGSGVSTYYDRYRPQSSSPKTEPESYYDRFRPHSVSSSNSRSELTATTVTQPSVSTLATHTSIRSPPSDSTRARSFKTAPSTPASSNNIRTPSYKTASSIPASPIPHSKVNTRTTSRATASASPTPRSRVSATASGTTLHAPSPPKFRTGATFKQSPLTDTNVSRMTPGSINYDPLPPSQCPSKAESVASISTSLLYGLRWVTPTQPPSSHNEPVPLGFPPKKAVSEWEERKRLMRAATSTPNFTTPSVATAKVAQQITHKSSDKVTAASIHKETSVAPERAAATSAPNFTTPSVTTAKGVEKVTHKTSDKSHAASAHKETPVAPGKASTIKAVLRTKETTPTPAPKSSTESKAKAPIQTESHASNTRKATLSTIQRSHLSLFQEEPKDAVEKWQQITALRKFEKDKKKAKEHKRTTLPTTPKFAPPKLTKPSSSRVVQATAAVSPPQDPPTRRSVISPTAPATPPTKPQSPCIPSSQPAKQTPSPSPTKPSGPRPPPAKKDAEDELHIPRFTLWVAGMSPQTYRNRMAAKREREAHLPAPLVEPRRETVADHVLDVLAGVHKVTREEKMWKQRDLGRKIEGLGEKMGKLQAKKEAIEREMEEDRAAKERRRMNGRFL